MPMKNYSIIAAFDAPGENIRGNTAAVIEPLHELPEQRMQEIASDLGQPATTFLFPAGKNTYQVRWFAPDGEIQLCGHGSLAAFAFLGGISGSARQTLVTREGHHVTGKCLPDDYADLLLPVIPVQQKKNSPRGLKKALGITVKGYYPSDNKHLVIAESEEAVKSMKPDFDALKKIKVFSYAVTAPGKGSVDFVSRTLVPHVSQLEDHATGSSHAVLAPYWGKVLKKEHMTSLQLSPRGGKFDIITGKSGTSLKGHFTVLAEGKLLDL